MPMTNGVQESGNGNSYYLNAEVGVYNAPQCILKDNGFELGFPLMSDQDRIETVCDELQDKNYLRSCLIKQDAGAFVHMDYGSINEQALRSCIAGNYIFEKLQQTAIRFTDSVWNMISRSWKNNEFSEMMKKAHL